MMIFVMPDYDKIFVAEEQEKKKKRARVSQNVGFSIRWW